MGDSMRSVWASFLPPLGGGVGADGGDGFVDDEEVGGVLAVGADPGQEVGGHSWFPSSARSR